MKKFLRSLVAILFVAIAQNLCAQDVITLKTGEDINVKVLEVGSADIKYKKADNPDGPSYTVSKNDVFMIKYQNGSKDVFNTTTTSAPAPAQATPAPSQTTAPTNNNTETKKDVETGIKNYQAQQEYDKNMHIYHRRLGSGITCTAIGVPFIITGSALLAVGIPAVNADYDLYDTETDYTAMSIVGGALVLAGIPLTIVGPIKISTAFKYKRRAQEAKANISFEPSIQQIAPAGNVYGTTTGLAMRITF